MTNVETPLIMLFAAVSVEFSIFPAPFFNQCLHNLVPVKLYTVDQFDNLLVSMKDLFPPRLCMWDELGNTLPQISKCIYKLRYNTKDPYR